MSHSHAPSDPTLLANDKGIYALKVSLVGLMATALLQGVIVYFSGSAALLGDTLHNLVDAFTAIPLWIAFLLQRRKPDRHYTYGYSRYEDMAGVFIVLLIFLTAIVVAFTSYVKLQSKFVVQHLEWVAAAAIIGYLGNEAVARFRIKVGREIKSPALVADGEHARADALTSLGVLAGAIGVYFGYPLADPLVGFGLAIMILKIGWDSGRDLFERLADAIPPEMVEEIEKEARRVPGVLNVIEVKVRRVGREVRVDLTIEVNGGITVEQGHEIAIHVQHVLQKMNPLIISPSIHVDPSGHSGEAHHFESHHHHT
jgi:cation diffusion facilitator family transporter